MMTAAAAAAAASEGRGGNRDGGNGDRRTAKFREKPYGHQASV